MDPEEQKEPNELHPEVTAHLRELLEKEVRELTPEDKAFLRARRSYLGKRARQKFADVLNEAEPVKEKPKKVNDRPDDSDHPADKESRAAQKEEDVEDDVDDTDDSDEEERG